MEVERGQLYLGGEIEAGTGERTGPPLIYSARDLTTHGVITAMTGSGKTGLGIVLLEEAILSGIPVLVLDPKGDMGNLLLTFPELRPADFEPWVDAGAAEREGISVAALAERTAARWKGGLAEWGVDPERARALKSAGEFTIFTPGSSAGVSLNLVGSLAPPPLDWERDSEVLQDEIEGVVSGLLSLTGGTPNPIGDPEHIFLSNLIEHEWRAGRGLDLPGLVGLVRSPPLRKLGVFPLDDFFPEKKRTELAIRLNGLLASSAFENWMRGTPLEMDTLLRTPDGRPTATILHLAHLSDAERQFVVTLVLTRLITWMRRQPGTSDLRLLVYVDEMFGFAPPTADPPSKKPFLTLFKQARAHGVGLLVSTQNPVDLDYRMMSNAGSWIVGRLQTERDKLRVLEALNSASGQGAPARYDALIGGLRKREFLLISSAASEPRLFTSRWAISFLRGPLTRQEVSRLNQSRGAADAATPPAMPLAVSRAESSVTPSPTPTPAPTPSPRADESPLAPAPPSSIPVYYLDPAAPWGAKVGAASGGGRLEAALVARVEMRFDDVKAGLDHREEWEAVFHPLSNRFDPSSAISVDYDDRDFRTDPPVGARYALPDAPITEAAFYRTASTALKEHLHRERTLEIWRNTKLKLYSRVGEEEEEFRLRCEAAAQEWADREAVRLRDRYATRIDRVREALAQAQRRVRELEVDVASRKQQEVWAGAGKLLSVLLGGKANAGALGGIASRRSMTVRTGERLQTAAERAEGQEEEIERLESELAAEILRNNREAASLAKGVEKMPIGLEKADLTVREVGLLWIPREDRLT